MTTPNEELRKQLQQIYKSGELYYRAISDTTDLLQPQAERIKELELDLDIQAGSIEAVQAANSRLAAERDTLRAELDKSTIKTCYAVTDQMRDAAHAALSKYKGAK